MKYISILLAVLCVCLCVHNSSFASAKKISATIDFRDNVWKTFKAAGSGKGDGLYTAENIRQMMLQLSRLGCTEVFWVYSANDYLQIKVLEKRGGVALSESQLFKLLVDSAHRNGLKFIVVYKPFESASNAGYPEPYFPIDEKKCLGNANGLFPDIDTFVLNNPRFRIKRKDYDESLDLLPVTSIKLVSSGRKDIKVSRSDIKLYTSRQNGKFHEYTGDFSVKISVEPRYGKKVNVVTLSGFSVPAGERYIWLEYIGAGQERLIGNREDRLLELYSEDKLLPFTLGISKLSSSAMLTRLEKLCLRSRDFSEEAWTMKIPSSYGRDGEVSFSFGFGPWKSNLYFDSKPGGRHRYVAACRGYQKYLNGLHPVYPEVREYWLSQIKKLVGYGIDGLDIRAGNHSTMKKDPENYGYNKPVLESYIRRYGNSRLDKNRFRDLQAEYYTDFLKEAKKITASAKLPLMTHVSRLMVDYFPRKMNDVPENFSWPWKSWIDQGIVDAVTLKYFPWPWDQSKKLGGEELAVKVAAYAASRNIPSYLNVRFDCWWMVLTESQRKSKPFTEKDYQKIFARLKWAVEQNVSAINLYEVNDFMMLDQTSEKIICSPDLIKMLKELGITKTE